LIFEQRDDRNQPELHFRLLAADPQLGLNLKPFGPTVLADGPGEFFTDLYREIEKLPVETTRRRPRRRSASRRSARRCSRSCSRPGSALRDSLPGCVRVRSLRRPAIARPRCC